MEVADALVVFTPSGRRGRFPVGSSLLQAGRSLGVDIDSVCGGRGICGRCQVLVSEGEFAKHGLVSSADHLSAVSQVEHDYCATQPLAEGRRLSCCAQVQGDVVIDVPSSSQVHKQVVDTRQNGVNIGLQSRRVSESPSAMVPGRSTRA